MRSRVLPTFSSMRFRVMGFMLRPLIHLDLSFVHGDSLTLSRSGLIEYRSRKMGPVFVSILLTCVFLLVGKFSSMILLNMFSVPLSWYSSASSIPIIRRLGLFMMSHISWTFCVMTFLDLVFSLTVFITTSPWSSSRYLVYTTPLIVGSLSVPYGYPVVLYHGNPVVLDLQCIFAWNICKYTVATQCVWSQVSAPKCKLLQLWK
ncbi:hypothetical protein STEG23_003719, partial [Scotinomys teguina]